MSRGVTDLNMNFLRTWGFFPGVSRHVFRPIGIRTTHGVFTPSHIPPLCAALPFKISHQDFFTSRSISLHGQHDVYDKQLQAFGKADLGHGGELGYISIVEIIKCGAELDLHWQP